MESEGKAAGGRVTVHVGGGYDWGGCDFFELARTYATKLVRK